jgi:hypothetical protein
MDRQRPIVTETNPCTKTLNCLVRGTNAAKDFSELILKKAEARKGLDMHSLSQLSYRAIDSLPLVDSGSSLLGYLPNRAATQSATIL